MKYLLMGMLLVAAKAWGGDTTNSSSYVSAVVASNSVSTRLISNATTGRNVRLAFYLVNTGANDVYVSLGKNIPAGERKGVLIKAGGGSFAVEDPVRFNGPIYAVSANAQPSEVSCVEIIWP